MKPYSEPGTFEEARKIMSEPYPTDFDVEAPAPWTQQEFEQELGIKEPPTETTCETQKTHL